MTKQGIYRALRAPWVNFADQTANMKNQFHLALLTFHPPAIQLLALFLCLLPGASRAETRTWTGGAGAGNYLASTPANWGGAAPAPNDDIILDSNNHTNMIWNMTNMTVGSWTQVGYTGTVTIATVYGTAGFTNFNIRGNCTIGNGVWTHYPNAATEVNCLRVTVGGNMIVGSNAAINVTAQGYGNGQGPGAPALGGGSYGGVGSGGIQTYGSIIAPTNLGSGGQYDPGGGAILAQVSGEIRNDGLICADGRASSRSGAGGSIWLTSGTLVGGGVIRANGGNSTIWKGGGGRIALIVTNAFSDFSSFTGNVLALAGGSGASAGTIYREKQGDVPGRGELIVNNMGGATSYGVNTEINSMDAVSYEFSSIMLTNGGNVNIRSKVTLVVTNTAFVYGGGGRLDNGIWISSGATLQVPPVFVYSNIFIGINDTGILFNPSTSLTIGTNAEFRVNIPYGMTNDLIVAEGGNLTHSANGTTDGAKINLTIVGSLVVHSGGSVNVTGKGYWNGNGPGTFGSYGGRGSGTPGPCYGSIVAPTNLGSAGEYDYGGGAILLRVSGEIRNDGLICADGRSSNRSGAGGSIWLTSGTLVGGGIIRANGGNATQTKGGGGRIALIVTNASADFSLYTGLIQAAGGGAGAGAGTIYKRCAADRPGRGAVVVDNNGLASGTYTDVPPGPPGNNTNEVTFVSFNVTNAAKLRLTNDYLLGDIWLDSANAWLDLGAKTLTVRSKEHPLGPGGVINPGQIVWWPYFPNGTIFRAK